MLMITAGNTITLNPQRTGTSSLGIYEFPEGHTIEV